jgi:hypothetical protein
VSDLGGCFLGCLWFAGWLGFEIWTVSLFARQIGWFWAVVLGLFFLVLPYAAAAAARSSGKPNEGPPTAPPP